MNEAATTAAEIAQEGFKVTASSIVVWVIGAGLIAFCVYKFITGKKKLKEKREAEAKEIAEAGSPEAAADEDEEY